MSTHCTGPVLVRRVNQPTCLPTAKEVAVLVIRFAFVDNFHLKVVLPQDDFVIDHTVCPDHTCISLTTFKQCISLTTFKQHHQFPSLQVLNRGKDIRTRLSLILSKTTAEAPMKEPWLYLQMTPTAPWFCHFCVLATAPSQFSFGTPSGGGIQRLLVPLGTLTAVLRFIWDANVR
jgi:hypothetical protein